jgi:hypothetical protein
LEGEGYSCHWNLFRRPKKEKVKLEVLKIEDPAEDVLPEATVGMNYELSGKWHSLI